MREKPATPLEDVLSMFALAKAVPDVETLEYFTKEYPAYADTLTQFAVDLLVDGAIVDTFDDEDFDDDGTLSPAVAKAVSFFHNAVYEIENAAPERKSEPAYNILADLDRPRFRGVVSALHANNIFVMKLRDRTIEPDTVTARTGFCQALAEASGQRFDAVINHLAGAQQIAHGQHYKSDAKPELGKRETFEEAVRNSGLTAEQQSYLLNL